MNSSTKSRNRTTPTSSENSTIAVQVKTGTHKDVKVKDSSSTSKPVKIHVHGCSSFKNCSTGCCIDGECVASSQCEPVKAARGGRGGGRVAVGVGVVDLEEVGLEEGAPLEVVTCLIGHGSFLVGSS